MSEANIAGKTPIDFLIKNEAFFHRLHTFLTQAQAKNVTAKKWGFPYAFKPILSDTLSDSIERVHMLTRILPIVKADREAISLFDVGKELSSDVRSICYGVRTRSEKRGHVFFDAALVKEANALHRLMEEGGYYERLTRVYIDLRQWKDGWHVRHPEVREEVAKELNFAAVPPLPMLAAEREKAILDTQTEVSLEAGITITYRSKHGETKTLEVESGTHLHKEMARRIVQQRAAEYAPPSVTER